MSVLNHLLVVALVTLLPVCNCAKLDVQAGKVVEQVWQKVLRPGQQGPTGAGCSQSIVLKHAHGALAVEGTGLV